MVEFSENDETKAVRAKLKIANEDLKELVAREIADKTVNAAFFSTYTFNRFFFEEEILAGLMCNHGQRRGSFPVTIVVDHDNFEGQGWGYNVCCPHNDRLWHPKVVTLMLEGRNRGAEAITVLMIGSGNLTPSGWTRNQEIFLALKWQGWVLPIVLEQWILSENGIAFETDFAHWYRDHRFGRVPKLVEQSLLSNYEKESVWQQWRFNSSWTKASVVSPFTEVRLEEHDNDPKGYFDELVKCADSEKAVLDVYLQGAPNGRVIGNWSLFDKLRRKTRLRIYRVGGDPSDRPLHAKLQLAKSEGVWHILGGSPNATERAMLMTREQGGNVELAWHATTDRVPLGLLPIGTLIQLRKSNFVMPCCAASTKRWRALESIVYDPKSQRLKPHWLPGHGIKDSRVLLDKTEVLFAQKVNLGTERAVATLPRNTDLNRGYDKDWVAIECPYGESDDPVLSNPLSLGEYLALMAGCEDDPHEVTGGAMPAMQLSAATKSSDGFEWHDKVASLQRALANLKNSIEKSDSPFEATYWLKIVEGCLRVTTTTTAAQDQTESDWKKWVRFEVYRCLLSLDRRRKTSQPFSMVAREWKKRIPPKLRRLA